MLQRSVSGYGGMSTAFMGILMFSHMWLATELTKISRGHNFPPTGSLLSSIALTSSVSKALPFTQVPSSTTSTGNVVLCSSKPAKIDQTSTWRESHSTEAASKVTNMYREGWISKRHTNRTPQQINSTRVSSRICHDLCDALLAFNCFEQHRTQSFPFGDFSMCVWFIGPRFALKSTISTCWLKFLSLDMRERGKQWNY